jgi:hypothetical protein
MGRPAADGGKAPAMFQMRQEALPDSCRTAAKAAGHTALSLSWVARSNVGTVLAVDAIERMPEFHQDHRVLAPQCLELSNRRPQFATNLVKL